MYEPRVSPAHSKELQKMAESLLYRPWLQLKEAVIKQQTRWLLQYEALEDDGWLGSPWEAHQGIPGQGPMLSGPGFPLCPSTSILKESRGIIWFTTFSGELWTPMYTAEPRTA